MYFLHLLQFHMVLCKHNVLNKIDIGKLILAQKSKVEQAWKE